MQPFFFVYTRFACMYVLKVIAGIDTYYRFVCYLLVFILFFLQTLLFHMMTKWKRNIQRTSFT